MKSLTKFVLLVSSFAIVTHSIASEVVATVNGTKITQQQLDFHIQLLQTMTKQKIDDKKVALDDLIDREIIHQEVKRQKIDQKPELKFLAEFQRRELFSKALR